MKKNSVTIILMSTSIVLLLTLQVFWLRSSYRDAKDNFRKETNILFRNTIFAMHDSLIQRSIEPIHDSSSNVVVKRFRSKNSERSSDSAIQYFNIRERTARIEIISSNPKDSIGKILRPLMNRMQVEGEPKNFIIRLGPDSLKKDSIKYYFSKALERAGIDAGFKVFTYFEAPPPSGMRKRIHDFPPPIKGIFQSEVVRLNPFNQYAVGFAGIDSLLVRAITPQILFAVFLTMITTISFVLMYRNIRTQQRLMEAKNEFISNVTHELKTPVATVSVALEALKNFRAIDNPALTEDYLDIARRELDRLSIMTDKILNASIYESKGVAFEPEVINLDHTIADMMASMKMIFEKQEAEVTYEKRGSNFEITGGALHLTNVIYNLVDNALKYSTDKPIININLIDENQKLVLSVTDNGVGVAAEYQEKIFEKFFRVPSGDIHNAKGYGLGLSYVASVVKSHHGVIEVVSKPNEGSTFTIMIPRPPGKIFKKTLSLKFLSSKRSK